MSGGATRRWLRMFSFMLFLAGSFLFLSAFFWVNIMYPVIKVKVALSWGIGGGAYLLILFAYIKQTTPFLLSVISFLSIISYRIIHAVENFERYMNIEDFYAKSLMALIIIALFISSLFHISGSISRYLRRSEVQIPPSELD